MYEECPDHIWSCDKSKDKRADIQTEMRKLIHENHKTGDTWKPLRNSPDLIDPQRLINSIGIPEEDFFELAPARGLITVALKDRFNNSHPLTLLYTMDCYMQAAYKHIWKVRNIALIQQDKEIDAYNEALAPNKAELEQKQIALIRLKRTGNTVSIISSENNQQRVRKKLKFKHEKTRQPTLPKQNSMNPIKLKKRLKLILSTPKNGNPTLMITKFIEITKPPTTPRLPKRKKPPDKITQNTHKRIKRLNKEMDQEMG